MGWLPSGRGLPARAAPRPPTLPCTCRQPAMCGERSPTFVAANSPAHAAARTAERAAAPPPARPCCRKGSTVAGSHCCARNLYFRRATTDFGVWKQVRARRLTQRAEAQRDHPARAWASHPAGAHGLGGSHHAILSLPTPCWLPSPSAEQIFQCHYLRYLYVLFGDEPPKYILDAGAPASGNNCARHPALRHLLWR